jgi:hypothetical protein
MPTDEPNKENQGIVWPRGTLLGAAGPARSLAIEVRAQK